MSNKLKEKKIIKLNSDIAFSFNKKEEKNEELSPFFSKAKIYVMYHGKNPNRVNLSKEVVERNLNTMKNVPIVGEYLVEKDNFKSHGGELIITDDSIDYVITTQPIGLIPESATYSWEIVKDKKDIEREYLVVNDALIWNRDYKVTDSLKETNYGQSMEITITDGEYSEDYEDLEVTDFFFTGLCILGVEKNGEGYVQPAFDDAKIITYNKDIENDIFEKNFSLMMEDFKKEIQETNKKANEEEKSLNIENILKKYSLTEDDLLAKKIDFEDMSEDDLVKAIEENFKEVKDPEPETVSKEEFDKLKEERDSLEAQVTELSNEIAEFKKESFSKEVEEKISEFKKEYGLSDEDVSEVENASFTELSQVESKLFEVLGRKMKDKSFSIKDNEDEDKDNEFKFNFKNKKDKDDETGYGDLLEKAKA